MVFSHNNVFMLDHTLNSNQITIFADWHVYNRIMCKNVKQTSLRDVRKLQICENVSVKPAGFEGRIQSKF